MICQWHVDGVNPGTPVSSTNKTDRHDIPKILLKVTLNTIPPTLPAELIYLYFQTYIIFSINLVSLVTLRSSGTDILYGCHLLLDVCILYFISCDCIMNSSLSYTIYCKNCWVRLLSNYNIKYICTIYTHLYTCLTSIPRFALREKVTLRLLKLLL